MSTNGRERLAERIPPELWTRIFQQTRDNNNTGYMLSLAIVCKAWTVRAALSPEASGSLTIRSQEPAIIALYNFVHIDAIAQLTSLARSVCSETHDHRRFIRHLRFRLFDGPFSAQEMVLWMEASHIVLLSATQMESFWNVSTPYEDSTPSLGSQLAVVRIAAQSTLRSLHLIITNEQARSVLFHLKSFARLDSLEITLETEFAISSGLIYGVSPGR
jgi:hypothetical protein